MSTYGTAFVVDLHEPARDALVEVLGEDPGALWYAGLPGGWHRFTGSSASIQLLDPLTALLSRYDGRAALAVDNDEYGALWVVLQARDGVVRTIHRRYVLNADPGDADDVALVVRDLGADPRADDVAGDAAATAAALHFDADVPDLLRAEAAAAEAWREIGVVGGPFPWWEALGLEWPGATAGELVHEAG